MYSKSTNNMIQRYDHELPCSNNKSIDKCKIEKNNIVRRSRHHVIKSHKKKRSSLLSSWLLSRIARRDMLVIIAFLVILISIVRPSTGTIVCNDENDCKEKCDRHCDFPVERNVDSNGQGLPGPTDKVPIEEPGFGGEGDRDIPPPAGGGGGGVDSSGGSSSSSGTDGTTTTASDTGGIGVGAVVAMSVGGFLVVAGAVALQRRPGGGLGFGGLGAGTGTSGEDLSAMASASGLESQTAFPPANNQSGMVDINLSDNV